MSAGHPARRAGRRLRACRAMATAAAQGNSKAVPSPTWSRTGCRTRSIGSPGHALAAASTRGPSTVVSLVILPLFHTRNLEGLPTQGLRVGPGMTGGSK
jgi:hypothetical protein